MGRASRSNSFRPSKALVDRDCASIIVGIKMLVHVDVITNIRMRTKMADGNQQKHINCYRVFLQKCEFILRGNHKH